MSSRLIMFTRILQLAAGLVVFALGLWIWLHIFLADAAIGTGVQISTDVLVFLMLVGPGLFVAVGSYLQAVHHKRWALAFVLIGSVAALTFVSINAYFVFGCSGDKWGLRAVFTDLFSIAFTLGVSLINAFAPNLRATGLVT